MKKILFLAVLAVSSLLFVSCDKSVTDANETAIAAVKADAMGSWEGTTQPFMGDGEFVTVTFTEKKVTVEFEDETESANIVSWNCTDGVQVWILLVLHLYGIIFVQDDAQGIQVFRDQRAVFLGNLGKGRRRHQKNGCQQEKKSMFHF